MSIPTFGETYSKLMEHLRLAQEDAAMLAHLRSSQGDAKGMLLGKGWLMVSEKLKEMQHRITEFAKAALQ